MALAILIRTRLDRNLAIKCNSGSVTNKQTIMAGYSGTPLPQKLGLKPNEHVVLINAPGDYAELLGEIPPGIVFSERMKTGARFAHLFSTKRSELQKNLLPFGSNWRTTERFGFPGPRNQRAFRRM